MATIAPRMMMAMMTYVGIENAYPSHAQTQNRGKRPMAVATMNRRSG